MSISNTVEYPLSKFRFPFFCPPLELERNESIKLALTKALFDPAIPSIGTMAGWEPLAEGNAAGEFAVSEES